eukprot:gnl/MRDRNA2_/MRDRNA2_46190_c0_seq1.p1 gnl/MRDRNA2_/MRDRNA2_46190_c0~~gnl/MRDRNA2_/MRDRNA2_46190_c0_seq1.p1  ORF type:complete len:113 (-),score=12.34 gnl/MRDRNA2_/MRDRNA2_46190_c0_seq1:57-395(-)
MRHSMRSAKALKSRASYSPACQTFAKAQAEMARLSTFNSFMSNFIVRATALNIVMSYWPTIENAHMMLARLLPSKLSINCSVARDSIANKKPSKWLTDANAHAAATTLYALK